MIVPENKIVVIPTINDPQFEPFDIKEIDMFLTPLKTERKRDWFDKGFYKCLPLAIGNLQGFVFSVPFDFGVFWNGGNDVKDLFFKTYEDELKFKNKWHINISSNFGFGIITINVPLMFKTPPNINLMTISPPNFLTPGLNPLTAVIETDNLRYIFTLNIKVNIQNTWINIKKNSPLIGIIPVPRNFCDNFEIVDANEIFNKKEIQDEQNIQYKHSKIRKQKKNTKEMFDNTYYQGTDILGNKFKNTHQLP
jgi:hypothetical protein